MLSQEQIAFFKDNGYLIVRSAMDTTLCEQVQQVMWDSLPTGSQIQRDQPSTQVGPFTESDRTTNTLNQRDGYRWLLRQVGTSELLLKLTYSETVTNMAKQLLGDGPLREATLDGEPMGSRGPAWPGGPTDPALGNEGARGIYFTLPYGDKPKEADRCHTDGHPFQLGLVGLLSDVAENAGAFTVWPKSHRRLYHKFQLRYDQPRIPYYPHLPSSKGIIHTAEYLAEIERLTEDTPPVACSGSAGDVIFWHHRTAHMAGHNYSGTIRQAVLADFWKLNLDQQRTLPPAKDMWEDWSAELQNDKTTYTEAFAQSQLLGAS